MAEYIDDFTSIHDHFDDNLNVLLLFDFIFLEMNNLVFEGSLSLFIIIILSAIIISIIHTLMFDDRC